MEFGRFGRAPGSARLQPGASAASAISCQTEQCKGCPDNKHRLARTHAMPTYLTDRESLERDCDLEFFVAGGPGGQHRNKVETGVRLRHRLTGIIVTATERRSQTSNREMAYERMAEKLTELQRVRKPRRPTRPSAAARERRIESKRRMSDRKKARRKIDDGE